MKTKYDARYVVMLTAPLDNILKKQPTLTRLIDDHDEKPDFEIER